MTDQPAEPDATEAGGLTQRLGIPPGLGATAIGTGLASFLVLGSWYVLKPIRDEIASNYRDSVDLLWTAVFFAMLVASPLFAVLAKFLSRRQLATAVYGFLSAGTFGFSLILERPELEHHLPWFPAADPAADPESLGMLGRLGAFEAGEGARFAGLFYVWCSTYTLFVVSLFWSFATDIFKTRAAKSLFGPIAAAGTLGGIGSSLVMVNLADDVDVTKLLLAPALMLLGALACLLWTDSSRAGVAAGTQGSAADVANRSKIGGGILQGLLVVFRSPYLLSICGYMLLASTIGSFLYQQQSEIVGAAIEERGERRAFLAIINLAINIGTLFSQLFLTAWLLKRVGIGLTLSAVPLTAAIGFTVLGTSQVQGVDPAVLLWIFVPVTVFWGLTRYSFSKPTKELLFTLVPRDQKYRSKNFIDTAVYRGGDMLGYHLATALFTGFWVIPALPMWALAYVAVPIALAMLIVAQLLGRRATRRQAAGAAAPALSGAASR